MTSTAVIELANDVTNAFAEITRIGPSMLPLRQAGLDRFKRSGLPTTNEEDWRFTSLKPLTEIPFEIMTDSGEQLLDQAALDKIAFSHHDTDSLVFIDGHFSDQLSQISDQPEGVTVSNLASAFDIIDNKIGLLSGKDKNPLIALNDAFFTDCLLYTSPSPRDATLSRMPSSA